MRDISEKVIAVALALPKVRAILLRSLTRDRVEVEQEVEHDDLPHFCFAGFARECYGISRDKCQYALMIRGQLLATCYPFHIGK